MTTSLKGTILEQFPALAAAQNYVAISDALNAPTSIPNPDPQGQIPVPLTMAALQSLLTNAEMAFVITTDSFTSLAATILGGVNETAITKIRATLTALATQATGGMSLLQVVNLLIQMGDRASLVDLALALEAHGSLSPATVATLGAAIQSTIPDPGYQAQIDGPSIAHQQGFDFVSPADVQWALEA